MPKFLEKSRRFIQDTRRDILLFLNGHMRRLLGVLNSSTSSLKNRFLGKLQYNYMKLQSFLYSKLEIYHIIITRILMHWNIQLYQEHVFQDFFFFGNLQNMVLYVFSRLFILQKFTKCGAQNTYCFENITLDDLT